MKRNRIIYNTSTGDIITTMRATQQTVDAYLAQHPECASMIGVVWDTKGWYVDTATQSLREKTQTPDYTDWMRERRNKLLTSCDWTQGADSPLSESKRAEWATYRQALRDMPDQYTSVTDKDSVVWPTKPA